MNGRTKAGKCMDVLRLFSRGGTKIYFSPKKQQKRYYFSQKSLKTYYFWPALAGKGCGGASAPLAPTPDAHG